MNRVKHKLGLAASLAILMTAGAANAQDDSSAPEASWYASGFVGAIIPLETVDADDVGLAVNSQTDFYVGAAFGRKLGYKFLGVIQPRIEAEVSYAPLGIEAELGDFAIDSGLTVEGVLGFDPDTVDTDGNLTFILANSYSDFIWRDNQSVVPYIGGGLGIAISGGLGVGTSTNFTGVSAAGLTVPLGNIELYGEGRYFRVYSSGPDLDGFTAAAGLRWKF